MGPHELDLELTEVGVAIDLMNLSEGETNPHLQSLIDRHNELVWLIGLEYGVDIREGCYI